MRVNNIQNFFSNASVVNRIISIIIVVTIGLIGLIIIATYAATNFGAIEAESGTRTQSAKMIADTSASNGQALQFGSAVSAPDPDPEPPTGNFVKPDASNTGPRKPLTRTLSSSEALAELRETKYLSGVRITGSLKLSGDDGKGWLVEDSRIETTGLYGIQSYISLSAFTGTYEERPVFRYVEVVGKAALGTGSNSATVYGRDIVYEYADMYGSNDIVKASTNMTIRSSWLHDMDHPEGAHCDAIQIVSGFNILVEGSRLDAYYGYSSDGSSSVPNYCSGALQTGALNGDISAVWRNNWFAGGQYTIRGTSSESLPRVDYLFRDNIWMRNGTSVATGRTNLGPHNYGPTSGTFRDFDDSNIWDDTGLPVR